MTRDPRDTPKGGHVAWAVGSDDEYVSVARDLVARGMALGEKIAVFGPSGSHPRRMLENMASIAADPLVDFLAGGPIEPETMFAMFREQVALARSEGYDGLRVMADMDWLLPASPPPHAIMSFELLLDRIVAELGATVFCVYHRRSFADDALHATSSVHPLVFGTEQPQFRITYGGGGTWSLSGEVDMAVHDLFETAVRTTAGGPCVIDVSGLEFIDAAGLRTLTAVIASSGEDVTLRGGRSGFRRVWEAGRFGELSRA